MQTFYYPARAIVSSMNQVVDRQPARLALAARYVAANRDLHERIKVLQTHAMTLLHVVQTNPATAGAQQALYTLEAEITDLRAELAWRKAEARGNEHSPLAHTEDA